MEILKHAEPNGYQQLTVSSTAVGLTVPLNSNMAVIICEDDAIRWRDDGTNPTASVGMKLDADGALQLNGKASLSQFKGIRVTTDAELNISYYKV